MWVQARAAIVVLVALTLVTGVAYPLLVTGVAQLSFAHEANGTLVHRNGTLVGSRLLGQPFESPAYFWGRLSATTPVPYNAGASGGSNLGPANPALRDIVAHRIEALRAADPSNAAPVPVDLVTASGSGLDPHISPAAALYQLARVARARGMDESRVRELVEASTERPASGMPGFGLLGEAGVNVLALNLALDAR